MVRFVLFFFSSFLPIFFCFCMMKFALLLAGLVMVTQGMPVANEQQGVASASASASASFSASVAGDAAEFTEVNAQAEEEYKMRRLRAPLGKSAVRSDAHDGSGIGGPMAPMGARKHRYEDPAAARRGNNNRHNQGFAPVLVVPVPMQQQAKGSEKLALMVDDADLQGPPKAVADDQQQQFGDGFAGKKIYAQDDQGTTHELNIPVHDRHQ
ncbi:hypothetical protein BC940DRAFT_308036 [Gongronella butleri]|nr:hypothetical protein BC940DRAFT_308036 [Gongronella butleri]